ncbi:L,D-transpeptidase [Actinomycetospora sp. OC33-EN07]|uniref:L,D-transpeptidase n=1 Tax=Actinomycetospora flava TaxID=3129232 RepID=A0ABU8MC78_9PSEU
MIISALAALLVGAGSAGAAPAAAPAPAPAVPAPAVPVAAPAPAVAMTAGTPCKASADACVDLSSQRAWLTDGQGNVTYGPVGALGGTRKYPTPTGTFSVDYKDADHVSNLYDADMPFSGVLRAGDRVPHRQPLRALARLHPPRQDRVEALLRQPLAGRHRAGGQLSPVKD